MSRNIFNTLTQFLDQLDDAKIHYTLARYREDTIMVQVTVPGERWEIEFLTDGSVEVEKFISDGSIYGQESLNELITMFAESTPEDILRPEPDLTAVFEEKASYKP